MKTRNQTDSNTLTRVCVRQRTDWTENWVCCTAEATHTSYAAATVAMEKMDSQPACGHTVPVYVQCVLASL